MAASSSGSRIPEIIHNYSSDLIDDWLKVQLAVTSRNSNMMSDKDLRQESSSFIQVLSKVPRISARTDISAQDWSDVRDFLTQLSRSRAKQGFSPSETATFVLSFKQPLFVRLRKEYINDAESFAEEIWTATVLLDKLALFSAEVYQKSRDEIISRQQEEMLELSTPVVKLWDGILALPLIGTLDSSRTQTVMESLLHKIVETGSVIAIIDITGVATVDTLVAQHLIKTVTAARLMGAECIISGIRPNIAATIVHLGVNLGDVITKASLADAFSVALQKTGKSVGRAVSLNTSSKVQDTHSQSPQMKL
jgi:rsbT co-antagonist protein RsbR